MTCLEDRDELAARPGDAAAEVLQRGEKVGRRMSGHKITVP